MKKMLSFVMCAVLLAVLILPVSVPAQEVVPVDITREGYTSVEGTRGVWAVKQGEGDEPDHYWYHYHLYNGSEYTVTFSDGSTLVGNSREIYLATGYWPSDIADPQSYENPWGVGVHTVPITLGDVVGGYTYTITETPVASVTASDTTVVYHVDGEWRNDYDEQTGKPFEDPYFHYDVDVTLTVTYKDGTVITGTMEELREQTGCSVEILFPYYQGYGQELAIGENDATVMFMGVGDDFQVVVEDKIKSVYDRDFVYIKRDFMYGEIPDVSGNVLSIRYADDTYEYIYLDGSSEYYVKGLGGTYPLTVEPAYLTNVGKEEITIHFLGESTSYSVNVKEPPETLLLTAEEDHTLVMTASYADGSPDDVCRILSMPRNWSSASSSGEVRYYGALETDNGSFFAAIHSHMKQDITTIELTHGYYGTPYVTSNELDENDFVMAWDLATDIAANIAYWHGDTTAYNGEVTEENFEDLLLIALYDATYRDIMGVSYTPPPGTQNTQNYVTPVYIKRAEEYVQTAFGVTMDLTQSELYDPTRNTILVPYERSFDYSSVKVVDYTPTFAEGKWYFTAMINDDQLLNVVLDEDLHIVSFAFVDNKVAQESPLGDLTGDSFVNMRDALALFRVVSSKDTLTAEQRMVADVDGDGVLGMRDTLKVYQAAGGKEVVFDEREPLAYTEVLLAGYSHYYPETGGVMLIRSFEEWQEYSDGAGDRWLNEEQKALFDENYFKTNALVVVEIHAYNIPDTVRIEKLETHGAALTVMAEVGFREYVSPALHHECRFLQVDAAAVADIQSATYVYHEVRNLPPNTIA